MLFVLRGVLALPAGSLFKGCVTFPAIKHLVQISSGSHRFNEQRPWAVVTADRRRCRSACRYFHLLLRAVNTGILCPVPVCWDGSHQLDCVPGLKACSGKAVDSICGVSVQALYIPWPLLIIGRHKFQSPVLKGHAGWLGALVFTCLWNTRYLRSIINGTWQIHALRQLLIPPVWDKVDLCSFWEELNIG